MNLDDENYGWSRQSSIDALFYTFDDIVDTMDDEKILNDIVAKYPAFTTSASTILLKKIFLEIISDEPLITYILKKYNLTMAELFTIIFRHFSGTFDTAGFIKKVRQKLSDKPYGSF